MNIKIHALKKYKDTCFDDDVEKINHLKDIFLSKDISYIR